MTEPGWVRVLPQQPGVCRLCRGWSDSFPRCFKCKDLFTAARGRVPITLPLALAVKGRTSGIHMARYKGFRGGTVDRTAFAAVHGLADAMLTRHEHCLAEAAGIPGSQFDVVTYIPGTHPRRDEPLAEILDGIPRIADRLESAVALGRRLSDDRAFDPESVTVISDVTEANVLVVDDTLTTGASVVSTAAAIKAAGARAVSVVALARHFVPEFKRCAVYYNEAIRVPFDEMHCALCDPEVAPAPLPLLGEVEGL